MSVTKCPACEGSMPQPAGRGRPRKWCSDSCRREAWRWGQSEDAMRGWLKFWAVLPPSDGRDHAIAQIEHRLRVVAQLPQRLGSPT